ncbi:hypothetical protein [Megasphaera sp.]
MEWLGIIGPVTALLLALGALFNFSVIKPVNVLPPIEAGDFLQNQVK